jgi:hypothetical protein
LKGLHSGACWHHNTSSLEISVGFTKPHLLPCMTVTWLEVEGTSVHQMLAALCIMSWLSWPLARHLDVMRQNGARSPAKRCCGEHLILPCEHRVHHHHLHDHGFGNARLRWKICLAFLHWDQKRFCLSFTQMKGQCTHVADNESF